MRQDVLPVVYCQLHIDWQLVQVFENLLANGFLYALQVVVRDLTAVSIPQSLFALIVIFRPFLIFWGRVVKCVHHHKFVVAQKHFDIWHRHDLA